MGRLHRASNSQHSNWGRKPGGKRRAPEEDALVGVVNVTGAAPPEVWSSGAPAAAASLREVVVRVHWKPMNWRFPSTGFSAGAGEVGTQTS